MSSLMHVSTQGRPTYLAISATGAPHVPSLNDAYVHVRITEPIAPTGWMVAYLTDGSALTVPGRDLVLLEPAGCVEGEVSSDGRDLAADDDRRNR